MKQWSRAGEADHKSQQVQPHDAKVKLRHRERRRLWSVFLLLCGKKGGSGHAGIQLNIGKGRMGGDVGGAMVGCIFFLLSLFLELHTQLRPLPWDGSWGKCVSVGMESAGGVSLIEGEQSGTSRIVSPLAPCLPPPFFWDKESLECLASPAVSNIQMIGGMVQGRGKKRRKDGGSWLYCLYFGTSMCLCIFGIYVSFICPTRVFIYKCHFSQRLHIPAEVSSRKIKFVVKSSVVVSTQHSWSNEHEWTLVTLVKMAATQRNMKTCIKIWWYLIWNLLSVTPGSEYSGHLVAKNMM